MISFSRINAVVLRHLLPNFRDPIRITDMLYYPFIDLVLFGFMAIASNSSMDSSLFKSILSGISCWYLVYRSSLEIVKNLLMEIWDHHLTNLLATPLRTIELILGLMFLGLIQATFTFLYTLCIIWLIFNQNIFLLLFNIGPFLPFFIISGWILGLLVSSVILYFGKTAEALCWAVPWLFAVVSGAWFPLKLFPVAVQKIAFMFPMSYLFEGVRKIILEDNFSLNNLFMGSILSLGYFILVIILFIYMFNKSKQQGLSRLD